MNSKSQSPDSEWETYTYMQSLVVSRASREPFTEQHDSNMIMCQYPPHETNITNILYIGKILR